MAEPHCPAPVSVEIFLIPGLYVVFQRLRDWVKSGPFRAKPAARKAHEAKTPAE